MCRHYAASGGPQVIKLIVNSTSGNIDQGTGPFMGLQIKGTRIDQTRSLIHVQNDPLSIKARWSWLFSWKGKWTWPQTIHLRWTSVSVMGSLPSLSNALPIFFSSDFPPFFLLTLSITSISLPLTLSLSLAGDVDSHPWHRCDSGVVPANPWTATGAKHHGPGLQQHRGHAGWVFPRLQDRILSPTPLSSPL